MGGNDADALIGADTSHGNPKPVPGCQRQSPREQSGKPTPQVGWGPYKGRHSNETILALMHPSITVKTITERLNQPEVPN